MEKLARKSFALRREILDLVYRVNAGHIGGDFSVCDILVALYYKHMNVNPENFEDPARDRFILSKGHSVEALYCVLADKGFFPKEDLLQCGTFGSKYIGHPTNKVRGIEVNTGSLGHGLPVAVGMALAGKMDEAAYRVYTVMGDGELAEGSVWEGFMAAGHYKLENLIAIIDRNNLQISGRTEEVMGLENLSDKLESFGWHVLTTNGNCLGCLDETLTAAKGVKGMPTAIIANTTKGFGVSFMQDEAAWHHKVPSESEYAQAAQELDQKEVGTNEGKHSCK